MRKGLCCLAVILVAAGVRAAAAVPGTVSLTLQAGGPEARRGAATPLTAVADIASGWHINAHTPSQSFLVPTELRFTLPPGITTDTVHYPPPAAHVFAFAPGQTLQVYKDRLRVTTALNVPADFVGRRVRVEAFLRYQTCNDSTCLPPATASAQVLLPVSVVVAAGPAPPAAASAGNGGIDVGGWLARRGLAVTLLLVALMGLGLNLTPCVYPLLSVTVAYFGTQGGAPRRHIGLLAAVYVIGIVLSFAAVGVVAALSGGIFGGALQRPPVLLFIAAVLVLLALSAFGVYEFRVPPRLLRWVGGASAGVVGALFMGLTMGIVAAPCVGPVVLGLLVFVGSRQSVVLGLELFAALGFGMGAPYLVLAMAAGSVRRLPRSGDWLLWVERLFGVVLLGMAAYFVTPLLHAGVGRVLLPAVIATGGVYLGFIDRSGRTLRRFRLVQRGVGVGAVLLAGWLVASSTVQAAVHWEPFGMQALDAARRRGQPVIIDFVADWCIPCHEMARTTFLDARVRHEAQRFVMLQADLTHESAAADNLVDHFQVRGVPTLIFVDSGGMESRRLVGYVAAEELLAAMHRVR